MSKKYFIVMENWSIGYEGPVDIRSTIIGIFTDYTEAANCFFRELEELKKEAETNGHLDTIDEDLDGFITKSWSAYEDGNYIENHIDLNLINYWQMEESEDANL